MIKRAKFEVDPANVYTMGEGKAIISHGLISGMPGVTISHAPTPGIPGTSADIDPDDHLKNAVVIRFATGASLTGFLDRLMGAVKLLAEKQDNVSSDLLAIFSAPKSHADRVTELLEFNNTKEQECRDLKARVRELEMRIAE